MTKNVRYVFFVSYKGSLRDEVKLEALKAGGINLEETWTIQDFFDNPLETIDKMIPHPSNLSENPQLEKIGEFGSDVE